MVDDQGLNRCCHVHAPMLYSILGWLCESHDQFFLENHVHIAALLHQTADASTGRVGAVIIVYGE